MSPTLSHWINGQAVAGQSGRTGDVFNPAIGEKIAEVPLAGDDEVANVVAAAKVTAPMSICVFVVLIVPATVTVPVAAVASNPPVKVATSSVAPPMSRLRIAAKVTSLVTVTSSWKITS